MRWAEHVTRMEEYKMHTRVYFNTCSVHLLLLCTMTNQCTVELINYALVGHCSKINAYKILRGILEGRERP